MVFRVLILHRKRYILILVLIIISLFMIFSSNYFAFDGAKMNHEKELAKNVPIEKYGSINDISPSMKYSSAEIVRPVVPTKINEPLSDKVHAFYYPWYGNPHFNDNYYHWNHKYLPSWRKNIHEVYPTGYHKPPDDIGSNFYPALGAYSSSDENIIEDHMKQCSIAGIGVISVSYYPPGQGDDNGKDWQNLFPIILDVAQRFNIKVAFHIEPYKDRTAQSVKFDLQHIVVTYGKHQAFYKFSKNNKELPLVYVYDSYQIKANDWKAILRRGDDSIRNTWFDAYVIGLVVERIHLQDILLAGFDGLYTYFATDGFTFGSTRNNWNYIQKFSDNHNLIFIPSVGPGYIDTRIRPWNGENTRNRLNGKYYDESWNKALEISPEIVSITSFNEWHEGTQIEKAIPKQISGYKYLDYQPHSSDYYLFSTRKFVNKFVKLHVT